LASFANAEQFADTGEVEAVAVLEVKDSFALSLAEAALKQAGIPYVVHTEDAQYLPGVGGTSGIGATPLWNCVCRIQVPLEMEETARELLEPLQYPDSPDVSE
jgi:hypothetical protein